MPRLPRYDAFPKTLESLAQPHVDSFDYFLGEGMDQVIRNLEPIEIQHPTSKQIYKFWFENAMIKRPVKEEAASTALDQRLFPRDCREMGTTYKAPFFIDLVWAEDGVEHTQRVAKKLGQMPIMLKSKACYLRDLTPAELINRKEEGTEFGGTFICNGIERIIRMLIQTRRHYIMALRRGAYRKRGPSFTEVATLIRCVRPDESSMTNRCHYLVDGTAVFAITIRRAEYFIPAGILLKCFAEVSDKEIYDTLVGSAREEGGHAAFVAERAELLLRQASRYGLHTRRQCIEYLGSLFRVALNLPESKSDMDVGEYLLKNFLFLHLDSHHDKLHLAYQMLGKLYALANGQCCEDNPDALTHHEVLLPGHLLLKFLKEQLEVCLDALAQHVSRDAERTPEIVNLQDELYVKKAIERWPDLGQKFEYLLNTGNLVSRSGLDLSQATGFTVVAEKLNFYSDLVQRRKSPFYSMEYNHRPYKLHAMCRYISHFRSIHRGAYFAELRTTTVRKLLPESWGFLCPVHTPDGSPCGLLNHLTAACKVVTHEPDTPRETESALRTVLASLGMTPLSPGSSSGLVPPTHLVVMLDGKVMGAVRAAIAPAMVAHLRGIKAAKFALEGEGDLPGIDDSMTAMLHGEHEAAVPSHLEVVHLSFEQGGVFPGVHLFTQAARMVRPVRQLASGASELVGSLEQCNMNIRCPDGGSGGTKSAKFTHEEYGPRTMLSVVASLTPYSDFNQSPRNMYQCQMAKQTMGTAAQALEHRTDNKLYRLQTPQTPITRTNRYEDYMMDEFPNGTNAVVAVLAYTGYDMEDAMILNKSSVERGFAHAYLYKTEVVNLKNEKGGADMKFSVEMTRGNSRPMDKPVGAFGAAYPQMIAAQNSSSGARSKGILPLQPHKEPLILDKDGLPHIGAAVWPGQMYYNAVDPLTGKTKTGKMKGEETAVVDQVTVVGHPKDKNIRQANIKLRFNRNPVIGDKFSSRHGQKGVLSRLYDDVDMPFCEATGMRPDLLINPHAFPSRMTIGMLIESLTGKAGAMTGEFVDASPFQSADKQDGQKFDPCENLSQALEAAGFARNGGEIMISGVTGEPFPVEIYIGVVYYQRLRHMVSDKFQVRSTGPINPLTRQPIKGRKFGGGIRFGEMERDSLLAHGAAYLLHDRLHACSDYHVMDVCANCGLLVSTMLVPHASSRTTGTAVSANDAHASRGQVTCMLCQSGKYVERVAVPYVFKYLVNELAAMNIRCSVDVK